MDQKQVFTEAAEARGHTLKRDKHGKIDWSAYWDGHGHAGPICTNCNSYWCLECTMPGTIKDCPVRVPR